AQQQRINYLIQLGQKLPPFRCHAILSSIPFQSLAYSRSIQQFPFPESLEKISSPALANAKPL
ncbi:MAG: hypothetical protein NZL93_02125, partial [Chthoniobacterales bacterium]|nr:hypothetical protein [Chthoniobacterales bacterium]